MVMIVLHPHRPIADGLLPVLFDLLKEGTEVQFFGHQDVPVSIFKSSGRAGIRKT
jgi:hypothetical protein